jgi:hypothetical protein
MWFKNKSTGLRWYVTDDQLQKRLNKSAEYEISESLSIQDSVNDMDYESLTKKELIKLADDKGIEADLSMKKSEIIETLQRG